MKATIVRSAPALKGLKEMGRNQHELQPFSGDGAYSREGKVTEFIVTTIEGKQLRGSSENARLASLVDQLSSKGHFELIVVSTEPGRAGTETNTVFFKHGIISISEADQEPAQTVSPLVGE